MKKINIFWFRRDLRLNDNKGLHEALKSEFPVLPVFIFDAGILDQLENKADQRVDYFHQALQEMHNQLKEHESGIKTYYGKPLEIFSELQKNFDVGTVFSNHDYEPQAIRRDAEIKEYLGENNIQFLTFKDQVIFEKHEVVKKDQTPYTVFTPYSKVWKEKLKSEGIHEFPVAYENFFRFGSEDIHSLEQLGFKKTDFQFTEPGLNKKRIENYSENRDFPALDNTTYLGTALRFGTVSVRKCVKYALAYNETWLNELIWREFFMQILYHFPKAVKTCFKEKYENIEWRNNEDEFKRWCEGNTGYPIVDAGMRQLNETGFMHNRVRMITASFLTKHLLIDWRWGEAYFAEKLTDYELASNNGNWQWAAGCGCDAAPYFRIFNPYEQTKKFDKDLRYINRWLKKSPVSTSPIIEHSLARARALEVYKKGIS